MTVRDKRSGVFGSSIQSEFHQRPGASSADEPANNRVPSANFTVLELHVVLPSFARYPSMVTGSPCLSEFLVQPWRVKVFGLPPSHCHRTTLPSASLASM